MANKARLGRLEKSFNPDPGRMYVMIDNQGKHWVNGQAYTEYKFNKHFINRAINAVRVGFDIGRV